MTWRRLPPVYSPVPAWALAGVFRRGAHEELAALLAAAFLAEHVVLTDRGTTALQLAIRRATEGRDRVVALPAFGCYDLATAAVGADVRVALYDVDPETLGPDPASLTLAFAAGAAAAVIAVPFGYAPDWDVLEDIARHAGAVLIEDAAQGHGGALADRRLGSLGTMSVLSFGRGKGWTGGGGGALLLRDGAPPPDVPAVGAREAIRTAALSTVLAGVQQPGVYRIPASLPFLGIGETTYRAPASPAGMPSTAAAVLLGSHGAAEKEARRRRRNGSTWIERFVGSHGVRCVEPVTGGVPGYLRYPVRVPAGRRPAVLSVSLDLGVVATYPTTLAALPAIRERRVDREDLPGADALVAELITLPTHGRVRPLEADRISKVVAGQGFWPAARPAGHAP